MEKADYIINGHLMEKIGQDYLVTTEHGDWLFLSKKERDSLLRMEAHNNPELFKKLRAKGIVLDLENIGSVVRKYRKYNSFLMLPPTLHIITVTDRCTQNCSYCLAASKPEDAENRDMEIETAREIVDFIFTLPVINLTIEFQGGEPLLNFDVVKYITEYSKKKAKQLGRNIGFNLVTNLRCMDRGIMGFLTENKFSFGSSLDGPKAMHDSQRPSRDGVSSYDSVVHWVGLAKKEFGYSMGLMPTVTKRSFPYWKEIVDEYLRLGVRTIPVRPSWCVGNAAANWKEVGYTGRELFTFWKNVFDYAIRLNREGVFVREEFAMHLLESLYQGARFMCMRQPCGAACSQLSYGPKGDIYACDAAKTIGLFRIGNVKKDSFEKVALSRGALALKSVTKESLMCAYCAFSPFCGICFVHAYGQQGSIVPKQPLDAICSFRKMAIGYIFSKLSSGDRDVLMKWI